MWSAGCTLYEILTGKVLFPGNHYIEQINLIIQLRGSLDEATKSQIKNEHALKYVEGLAVHEKKPIGSILPADTSPEVSDLLDKMLDLNPQ